MAHDNDEEAPSAYPRMIPASKNDETTDGSSAGVATSMNYLSRDTVVAETHRDLAGSDSELKGATWEPTDVFVGNARLHDFKLHVNGFELRSNPISSLDIDFYNQKDVIEKYYPICEALVSEGLLQSFEGSGGNVRLAVVKAFDHNVRCSKPAQKSIQQANKEGAAEVQGPLGFAHVDYTHASAPQRLRDLAKSPKVNDVLHDYIWAAATDQDHASLLDPRVVEEATGGEEKEVEEENVSKAKSKPRRRFAIVNVWRNVRPEPVQRHPLGFVNSTSACMDDLRTFRIHYEDRVGENYFASTGARMSDSDQKGADVEGCHHEWWYYPLMEMDEAVLLKQWDSIGAIAVGAQRDATEGKPSTFTIHSAFLDPTSRDDAPARESIEVRCAAIWDEE